MSRIQSTFSRLRASGRKALIPYLTAGDPDLPTTLGLMHALVSHGADIIELGYPFSDPSSDGPVIQRAVERALARNTRLKDVLGLVKQFRASDQNTPIVLMGYLNPVEHMGYAAFAEAALSAGVDGVLIVDLPPEEAQEPKAILRAAGLDTIFLVAPTTDPGRMERICKESSGYVYYVSLKGVTGAAHLDIASVQANLALLRTHTDLPIGVGFGIRDAESAARIASVADAVVVGSALVSRIALLKPEVSYTPAQLREQIALIAAMRTAMDAR
ncbi:MAG: tryptophan synthase subunit alpha [Pseudomonadales bacterium]|jgi:tryptophan synthase alpha chain|nr:tryptophan synthase subunit alpha [Pseudomonadales bacterium]